MNWMTELWTRYLLIEFVLLTVILTAIAIVGGIAIELLFWLW
jgi:hypothetical protein